MKNITIILFTLLLSHGWAQPPAIEWQKTYGSSGYDFLEAGIIQTSDGGYLVSGYSYPGANLDKSSFVGGVDYWVIRLDGSGNKVWDRTFGGSGEDVLTAAVETRDGGFILAGYSTSPASGHKTEPSKGNQDYWIVNIDGSGNKLWDKVIGSPTSDILRSIVPMAGGRYALGGYSYQATGGDKSSSSRGGNDYWVVVIDEAGHLVWERVYGGSSDDYFQSIVATIDGGLIMAGYSISSSSFDKSETSKSSSYDYWVVKADHSGNKQWDRTLGGAGSDIAWTIVQAPDGGYLIGGYSNSAAGYDKTTTPRGGLQTSYYCSESCGWSGGCCGYTTYTFYNSDYWVVKLNASGSRQWDKTYGTAEHDELRNITVLQDGFLLTGHSAGLASYDKSENGRGGVDNWIINVNAFGNRVWDKTIGGNSSDHSVRTSTVVTDDGGFVLASVSHSGVSGDKTEAEKGQADYWIVKFEPMADTKPPVFQIVPGNITASIEPGTCAATVSWTPPTVIDNVGVKSSLPSHLPGSKFPFGQTTVTYTAEDAAGNTSTSSFIVNVIDDEKPVPKLAELPVISGECGAEVTVTPTAIDNCSQEITGTTTAPLSYSAQGTYTITWTYDDENGNVFEQNQTILVKDVTPPTVTQIADINQSMAKDFCGAVVTFPEPEARDNCGLKSFARLDDVPYNSGDRFPEGTFEIIYEAVDIAENVTVMSFQVTVSNQIPDITSVNASLDPHPVGASIPVTVAFDDDNVVNSEINWGDGTASPGTLGDGSMTAEHVYTTPGVYSLGVKVIDACGVEGSMLYQYVVIYDPYGGFVTGGGWFDSPAGAYAYNAHATGKATFGFVAKYQKGSSVPTGNTDFQFHAGDLRFKSTSYEWLVVAGYKAMYKGLGDINGSSGYGFLISAVDGAKNSNPSPDKFRIKIWDASGSTVYDNQSGAGDDAEATTSLGGGSIVIHDGGRPGSSTARMSSSEEETMVESEEAATIAFPNPFSDVVTVQFHSTIEADVNIDLLDVTGQSFHTKTYAFSSDGSYQVDLRSKSLARKMYFLKVTQGRRVEFLKVLRE